MKISTNQFKNGTKLIIDNAPCSIVEHEFHKPGKGQAVMRVKYKNLLTGNTNDKTFKSGESAEGADINHSEMEFLYHDNDTWHFMNTNTYDQIEINASQMGDAKKWLVGQEVCEIVLWNGQPISVSPPVIVELKIISSEPGIKGDTVSGAMKNATLETNINIQVPLFVNENEVIKVDTRNMTYVGRVKS
jgi:elongation factor P|tara:strand:- start:850 stop:1416 length:567 start_codon:yes stop_codon:yes gene_type:complete